MKRAALICPGRGSYTESSLHSLPADHPWVAQADALRRELGLESLLQLDRADKFSSSRHLHPVHASMLIWLRSMLDAEQAMQQHRVVCITGNSMGWYTALAVAGALSFDDGFRLAQTMALLQSEHAEAHGGGQILYSLVDDRWRPDPERLALVGQLQHELSGELFESIRLGGYSVLAGTERGLQLALERLAKIRVGKNTFPLRLAQHGPYHTPLLAGVADQARDRLSSLGFTVPRTTLIDGRGKRFTSWSTDVEELRDYTLGAQVVSPFDFTASMRVVLREYAPEQLVLLGPGNSLGGVCGQILVAEGWHDLHDKSDLDALQAREQSPIVSMGR